MKKWKDEIEKEIGSTEQAKRNTWNKMNEQLTKKKDWRPWAISLASLTVTALLLLIIFNPQLPVRNTSGGTSPVDEEPDGTDQTTSIVDHEIQFKLLEAKEGSPLYIETVDGVVLLEDENAYDYYADLFEFAPERAINFETHQGLIVAFGTDGCGLEIKEITLENGELVVTFQLPEELRNKKDYACTSILKPNIHLLEIEKIEVEKAFFKDSNLDSEVPLNNIQIYDHIRDFEMLFNEGTVGANLRYLNEPERNKDLSIEEAQQLGQAIMNAMKIQGFVDMMEPTMLLTFHGESGASMVVQLHVNDERQHLTVVPVNNTHAAYVINLDGAAVFYEIIDSIE